MTKPYDSTLAADESNQTKLQEIVVTGSRTTRDGYNAPTPVTTLNTEQMLRAAPTNLPDALNQLPQFANSASQRNGNVVDPTQEAGGNNLDLRSLGPNRVLILLDGLRVAPSNSLGTVDINTFPQLLVKSVDVVTGGVSAVYGADAVSGVVNFVLDKEFKGFKGYLQGGLSSRADDGSGAAGFAVGNSIADDRLHLLFSAEYSHSAGIPHNSDRPNGAEGYMRIGSGTASDPYLTVPDVHHSFVSFGGFIGSGPLAGMTFRPDGTLAPFDFGQPVSRGYQIGGDGADWGNPGLIPSLETANTFGRAEWRVNDDTKAYVQASYALSRTKIDEYLNYDFFDISIFQNNAFLSQEANSLLQATNTPSFVMSRINRDFGYVEDDHDNRSLRLAAGVDGLFFERWNWKTYFTYGRSELRGTTRNQTKPVELAAALDAVRDSNGNIVCNVTLTNPGLHDDCVPLNIFGEGKPSAAALAYVTGAGRLKVVNDALEFGAEVSGDLFSLPSGPVKAALGASYRRQSIDQTSNSDPTVPVDATGIRGVTSTAAFSVADFGLAKGASNVKEVFLEQTAPVLADLPFIHRLELNAAARYVDYSTFGHATVWKAGFVHQFTPQLRFRLTKSHDIRAPSLYNQFAAQSRVVETVTDPLTGVTGTTGQTGGGNPKLKPELGDTLTFGLGYRPEQVRGLSLAADYYDVKIRDAINNVDGQTALNVCHNSGYTDPLCGLITRPFPVTNTSSANFPTQINSLTDINIGFLRTKGIDLEASYRFSPRMMPGTIDLRLLANYVNSFTVNNGAGLATQEYVGFIGRGLLQKFDGGMPRWRGTLNITYDNGPFSAFVQERYINSLSQVGGSTPNDVYADGSAHIPAVFYTDLSLEYGFRESGLRAFLSVNNLFDRKPPLDAYNLLPNILYPSVGTVYDLIGMYLTVGIRARF